MKRVLGAILFVITITFYSLTPALAQDAAPAPSDSSPKPADSTPTDDKATTKSSGNGLGQKIAHASGHFIVCIPGIILGTPVAMVRKSGHEIVAGTKDLSGDFKNPIIIGACGVLGVPFGCVSGFMEAMPIATINSWKAADSDSYGKDYFSLGEWK